MSSSSPSPFRESEGEGLVFESLDSFQRFARDATTQEWEEAPRGGSCSPRCLLYVYHNGIYDVTSFVDYHPGGADTLYAYHGEDITNVFDSDGHVHTVAARNMLLQYKVGVIQPSSLPAPSASQPCDEQDGERFSGESSSQGQEEEEGGEPSRSRPLVPYPCILPNRIEYRDFVIRRDRGLIWQTMRLTKEQYDHCISTPIFLPSCRLFDSDILEALTSTPYWVAPLLWLPLAVFWLLRGVLMDHSSTFHASTTGVGMIMRPRAGGQGALDAFLHYPNNWLGLNYGGGDGGFMAMAAVPYPGNDRHRRGTRCLSVSQPSGVHSDVLYNCLGGEDSLRVARAESHFHLWCVGLWFVCGLLAWTLLEYLLHRVVFHFERVVPDRVMDHPYTRFLHMIIHGIHHIIPMDPGRLIFPPVLFVIVCSTLHTLLSLVMTGSTLDVFVAAMTIGYLCYDMTHYSVHQRELRWCSYYRDLKQYHSAHHFVNDRRGYGVSNKLWDYVFGTQLLKHNGAYYTSSSTSLSSLERKSR